MGPLIGISLCLDDRGRWKPERRYQYIDTAYARAVVSAGGTPVYLPLGADPDTLLDGVDGLLLPGGDDLAPPRAYPGDVRFDPAPDEQVAFDRGLLACARARSQPVLGICYGMQILSLEAGGTLLYDIATDAPDAAPHQLPEREGRHELRVEPGSRLDEILGDDAGPVNSLHHQAVTEPGRDLRVCARAGDGLVEAVEGVAGAFCVGVQWHPEKLDGPHRERLFGAFVRACRG